MNIQVISAAGSHYEIGRAVGSAVRKKLTATVDCYKKIFAVEGWRGPWSLPEQYEGTIFSVIFDLSRAGLWVAAGNPCRNRHQQISFATGGLK